MVVVCEYARDVQLGSCEGDKEVIVICKCACEQEVYG